MSRADFLAMLPLLIVGYGSVVVMTIIAFWRSNAGAFWMAIVTLLAGLASIPVALDYGTRGQTPLLAIDSFSLYFTGLIYAAALLVALLAYDYISSKERQAEAFYVLLLFAALGMAAIACSAHWATFFLGIETLSVSLFGLIGYSRGHKPSLEAAVKYLVLSATSSAFLLFGIALIYSEFGMLSFRVLGPAMRDGLPVPALLGLAMVLVSFGFKLAVAPFHMWSPDVYQGAPAPVTALIASGSKGAVFALLLRFASVTGLSADATTYTVIYVLAVATMFTGNLLALLQTNVKRLLAYSSIAQIGYLLIPLLAGGRMAASSIAFYIASYFATVIAAFGVIAILSRTRPAGDADELSEYRGLAFHHPVLAAIMALAMLSLTGIPLTSGFIAKFYIFSAAARAGLWSLLIIGVINSGISAFYYLRVLVTMYIRPETEPEPLPTTKTAGAVALAVSLAVMVVFGIYPTPLIRLAEAAVRSFGRF